MSAAVAPEQRADTSPSRRRIWRWMRRVGIVLGLVLAGVLVLSVLGALVSRQDISLDELQAVGLGASRIRQWGLVLQCLLLGAMVTFWRPLVPSPTGVPSSSATNSARCYACAGT